MGLVSLFGRTEIARLRNDLEHARWERDKARRQRDTAVALLEQVGIVAEQTPATVQAKTLRSTILATTRGPVGLLRLAIRLERTLDQ